jgi:hypothetical protein
VKLFYLKIMMYVDDDGEWCAEGGTGILGEGNNMREKQNA